MPDPVLTPAQRMAQGRRKRLAELGGFFVGGPAKRVMEVGEGLSRVLAGGSRMVGSDRAGKFFDTRAQNFRAQRDDIDSGLDDLGGDSARQGAALGSSAIQVLEGAVGGTTAVRAAKALNVGRKGRYVAALAGQSPQSVVNAAAGPELTSTAVLADALKNTSAGETMARVTASPGARVATNVALEGALSPAVDGVAKAVPYAGKVARPVAGVARRIRDALPEIELPKRARDVYRRLVDEVQPLRDFGRNVGGTERVSQEASRAKGWRGAADVRVRASFRPVLEAARGNEEPIRQLAKAERIIELSTNGTKNVEPSVLAEAQRTVADLSQVPEVRNGVDKLRGYYRELLDAKLANGVIDKEMYDAIVSKGEAYTPLLPEWIANKKAPTSGSGRLVPRTHGVRKMATDILGESETVDPFEQAILDTYEAERTISKQRVTNVVRDIVETNPDEAAPFIRKVASRDAAKHGRIVEANVGGKRQLYEVLDDDLYDAWAAFDPQSRNIFHRVLAVPKRTLQAGVTLLPDFALANAIRDNAQSAVQYKAPVKSMAAGTALGAAAGAATDDEDRIRGAMVGAGIGVGAGTLAPNVTRTLRAVGDIVGDKEIYREWLREGGGGFGEFYAKPKEARKLIAQEMRRNKGWAATVLHPKSPLEALAFIGRTLEEAPRVARYKAMREAGKDAAEAAFSSRDLSLDFARIGKDTKGVASITAFFNAKVQGVDKLARLLKNPKTAGIAAASITAPSVALWMVNKDNPEYWQRPQWERNLFWLVPRDDGRFWRIPKPFELGFIFASVPERLLDYAYQRDPENLKFALRDMLSTSTEGTLPMPTAIEPHLENKVNYDFFKNRPVVSRPDLPNQLQQDEKTSSVAVGIGKATGMSPQKIDNVLRGYTGSAGSLALDATDAIARKTGLDDRPLPLDRKTPLVSRFVTSDQGRSDDEQNFHRRFAKAEEAYRGARELLKRGDREGFVAFMEANQDKIAQYDGLQSTKSELDRIASQRREILKRTDLSREEKREILAFAAQKARQIASGAVRPVSTSEQVALR